MDFILVVGVKTGSLAVNGNDPWRKGGGKNVNVECGDKLAFHGPGKCHQRAEDGYPPGPETG